MKSVGSLIDGFGVRMSRTTECAIRSNILMNASYFV